MTAASARTLKEARALLYPWCGVSLMCAIPLLSRLYGAPTAGFITGPDRFGDFLSLIGMFMGIPLLACLSFGNEFRYKTMDLLVSQPVHRLKIWREKWVVAVFAVLAAALFAYISNSTNDSGNGAANSDFALFLLVTTCSAPFWTLLGRSTLGGLVLNIAVFVLLISVKTFLWGFSGAGLLLLVATLGYSAAMLWLSQWMLVRRQSGAGLAGPDVTEAIPTLLPPQIASWFRCRPDQVVLNLIRKEMRMLRPLWLFMILYIVGWSAMAIAFSFVPDNAEWTRTLRIILVGVTATYPVIAIYLSASLSLGEERAFGVQLWHLALPLSMSTQWRTRLLSALAAGLLSAIAVPAVLLALARAVLRPEFMQAFEAMTLVETAPVLLAFFFFVFWCAIIARDVTRTAGVAVVAVGMIFIAAEGTAWFTTQLAEGFEHLRMFVISRYQLSPYAFSADLEWLPDLMRTPEWIATSILCAAMTIHTYPLHRRLPDESALRLMRPLLPYLAIIVMVGSMSTIRNWSGGWLSAYTLFHSVEKAVVEAEPSKSFTVEDLSKKSNLSERTRQWLRNSNITVSVMDQEGNSRRMYSFANWKVYSLSIRLPSGITCKSSFLADPGKSQNFMGNASAKCE